MTFSQLVKKRAITLLGHLIRAKPTDPMKTTTLSEGKPIEPPYRRRGRPKNNWTKQTFELAWEALQINESYTGDDDQLEYINIYAEARMGPFKTTIQIDLTNKASSTTSCST